MRFHRDRIVVTGIGVVAPNGIGKEEFWENCLSGTSGIKPITLFDTSAYRCHLAGEISNFQPEKYLGSKGLRNLDRTTLLVLVAAKLAIEDAKLNIPEEDAHSIGVVLGSTMGSIHSISSFDIESLREGPRFVNPAVFPNTVINSPASRIAIRFGVKGLNSTIGTGFTASLDALEYAANMLLSGRLNAVLVGGVEELCIETYSGFHELNLLNESNGTNDNESLHPTKPRVRFLIGEGSGIFLLEAENKAKKRKAVIQGYLEATKSTFMAPPASRFHVCKEEELDAFLSDIDGNRSCLKNISFVSFWTGNVSNEGRVDKVLKKLLRKKFLKISIKDLIGECFSATGILQLIAGIGIARENGGGRLLVANLSPVGNHSLAILYVSKDSEKQSNK